MDTSTQDEVELQRSQTTSCIEAAELCNYEIDSKTIKNRQVV